MILQATNIIWCVVCMSDHEYGVGGVSRVNYIYMCRAIQLLYNAIGVIQGIHCMQYGAGCICLHALGACQTHCG